MLCEMTGYRKTDPLFSILKRLTKPITFFLDQQMKQKKESVFEN